MGNRTAPLGASCLLVVWAASAAAQEASTPSSAPAEVPSAPAAEPGSARPSDVAPPPSLSSWQPHLEPHVELLTVLLLRDDSDFDRTPPSYDSNGQSVGLVGTLFRPTVAFHASRSARILYEAELGLNVWSKHTPDQQDPLARDIFLLKHRQVFVEAELERTQLRVGYARHQDPTGLFLHHWIGVASVTQRLGAGRVGGFLGQVPDSVYEGIVALDNNFRRDVFVGGATVDWPLGGWKLAGAVVGLLDSHIATQTRWLAVPALHLEAPEGEWNGFLDVALQVGQEHGVTVGAGTATTLSWALQAHATRDRGNLTLDANLLLLSPDDRADGNRTDLAFVYSGKTKSATVMLSEDELRDFSDNLDERLATRRSGFFVNRAGYALVDVRATWAATPRVSPGLIVGAASALQPANALGGILVGVEADAFVEVRLNEQLKGKALVGALFPGAAGATVNAIDLTRQTPVLMGEVGLVATY